MARFWSHASREPLPEAPDSDDEFEAAEQDEEGWDYDQPFSDDESADEADPYEGGWDESDEDDDAED